MAWSCILCLIGGGKNKEEIDDKPPVLEEDFPTLKQASMMAKGVKLETKMKKQKDIEHLSTEPGIKASCFWTQELGHTKLIS